MIASTTAHPDPPRGRPGSALSREGWFRTPLEAPVAPPISAAARAERGRYAVLRRHHPDKPELAEESLRRLRVLRAEDYVRGLVTTPPVPDIAERALLASLLKPAEVYGHILARVCRPGDLVLDPFAGSGSSRDAAGKLDLVWRGCDIDAAFAETTSSATTSTPATA